MLWSGQLDEPEMLLVARTEDGEMMEPLAFHRLSASPLWLLSYSERDGLCGLLAPWCKAATGDTCSARHAKV